ncbi:MAG: NfeD family protein, partial [Rikenellaceae bacterium]|nr:NfeD family protein [Rikenellaceae bacterium]
TNADALIGRVGRVSHAVDNAAGIGRVTIDGDDWRAVSSDDTVVIPVGQPVEVVHRDSIVLTVKPQ